MTHTTKHSTQDNRISWIIYILFFVIIVLAVIAAVLFVQKNKDTQRRVNPSLAELESETTDPLNLAQLPSTTSTPNVRKTAAVDSTQKLDTDIEAHVEWLQGGGAYILYAKINTSYVTQPGAQYQGWLIESGTKKRINTGTFALQGNAYTNLYTSNRDHSAFDHFEIIQEKDGQFTVVYQASFK